MYARCDSHMKILLLAPHPFYQERGTPIAVDLLVGALEEQGHRIDLLTYHEGSDRAYGDAVRIHRIQAPPGCHRIRPGFSLKKLGADLYMHRQAMRMAATGNYDVVHAVEESAFMARRIRRRFGVPYIFDMDSSMPVQIADALPFARPVLPLMRYCERLAIRDAAAVTAVCDALADIARAAGARHVVLLRDVPLTAPETATAPVADFRTALGIDGLCLLYLGNLEKYQGIELLLRSFARLPAEAAAQLVIIGGIPKHIAHYRALADELGIGDRTHFPGPRPVAELPALLAEADILVSPRTKGQNTPMKIYSYMAAGKAILATDLPTHTQVLNSECARLAAPEPEAFAAAMHELILQPEMRAVLGAEARRIVSTRYSLAAFKEAVQSLYALLPGKEEHSCPA
jgi:glycosyltransferase involved in cell wall biosynthesis